MDRVQTALGALIRDGKVLLGLRSKSKSLAPCTWDIIGGHCEEGETLAQTLSRELQEELAVEPTSFYQVATILEDVGECGYAHSLFVVENWEGQPINASKEHDCIEWFSFQEVKELRLASEEYPEVFESHIQESI